MFSSIAFVHTKSFCMKRTLNAIALSILLQIIFLEIFLLIINLNLLNPIRWFILTIGSNLNVVTWLKMSVLTIIVNIYGILLSKSFFSGRKYYSSRFHQLTGTICYKVLLCSLAILIGICTAWVYATFLPFQYKSLTSLCFENECLNRNYVFLIWCGVISSVFYFYKSFLFIEPDIEIPIIRESIWVRVRNLLYTTIYNDMLRAVPLIIVHFLTYSIIGERINTGISSILNVTININHNAITWFIDIRLVFYAWILSVQIMSNLRIVHQLLLICLVKKYDFPIEKAPMNNYEKPKLTLVDALSVNQIPLIQTLAAINLYDISMSKSDVSRQKIFSLSLPGGHAYNWSQILGQSLSLIESFTEDLAASVKNISSLKTTPFYERTNLNASEAANKILLRQYNASSGIRQMIPESSSSDQTALIHASVTSNDIIKERMDQISQQFDNIFHQCNCILRSSIKAVPGVVYLFGEQEGSRTAYLLSNSCTIVWLIQGLAGICTKSIIEDKYGIVQSKLSDILKAHLKLKYELDKLNNVNLNGRKLDRSFITLKNAIKRSLYKICSVFGDYLGEIIDDSKDLRNLQEFVCYVE